MRRERNEPLDTHDEVDLRLGGNIEVTSGLGGALEADLLTLLVVVLVDIGLRSLEDDLALVLTGLRRIERCWLVVKTRSLFPTLAILHT